MGTASSSAHPEEPQLEAFSGMLTETPSLSSLPSPASEKSLVDKDPELRPLDNMGSEVLVANPSIDLKDSAVVVENVSKDLDLISPPSGGSLNESDDDMSLRQFLEELVSRKSTVPTRVLSQVPTSVMPPTSVDIATVVSPDSKDEDDTPLIILRRRKLRVSDEVVLARKSRLHATTRWKRQKAMGPNDLPICLDDKEPAPDEGLLSTRDVTSPSRITQAMARRDVTDSINKSVSRVKKSLPVGTNVNRSHPQTRETGSKKARSVKAISFKFVDTAAEVRFSTVIIMVFRAETESRPSVDPQKVDQPRFSPAPQEGEVVT
ncbi:hypothetical protein H6P81_006339 [Aristolochia fimbriata]|uniref:Uncharacterized protein n=1 Tax=Aristolochia fimbriata TaxID=158543 RepID=A0AAV7EX10_ARIFI|nr:hypothetical protein H6P81_006339 [Aristolochia fimbriata]